MRSAIEVAAQRAARYYYVPCRKCGKSERARQLREAMQARRLFERRSQELVDAMFRDPASAEAVRRIIEGAGRSGSVKMSPPKGVGMPLMKSAKAPANAGKMAAATIRPDQNVQTVGDLAIGTLFRASNSPRLFVKAGDGLGPNGRPLKARIGCPPILAIVVPENGKDRRAWTPATERLTSDTRVVSTHGVLSVGF